MHSSSGLEVGFGRRIYRNLAPKAYYVMSPH